MNRRDLRWLSELLSCPTAPFRETAVIAAVTRALSRAGVPHFHDPVGNIVVGAASRAHYRRLVHARSADPLRVFNRPHGPPRLPRAALAVGTAA